MGRVNHYLHNCLDRLLPGHYLDTRLDAFLWILALIVWCVIAGTGAKHFDGDAIKSLTGANGAAAIFSFIAVIFSFAVSWTNYAADYHVKITTPFRKQNLWRL